MKKWVLLLLSGLLISRPLYAQDLAAGAGLFANAKEVFRPLIADPYEIRLGMRVVMPLGQQAFGEIEAGEYFGLYRWILPWKDAFLQWSIAGGVLSRFDLVSKQKDNEVIDYYANMPLDLRVGQWALRFMPYHISSHLGDDYIKRTGALPEKRAFDSLKTLAAYDLGERWRFYSGFDYILRNLNSDPGRWAIQGGAEWSSRWWAHNHAQFYWATDLQSWERTAWNPDFTSQAGIRFARTPEDKQALAVYTEYGSGHMVYGQFYTLHETHWILGMRFEIP